MRLRTTRWAALGMLVALTVPAGAVATITLGDALLVSALGGGGRGLRSDLYYDALREIRAERAEERAEIRDEIRALDRECREADRDLREDLRRADTSAERADVRIEAQRLDAECDAKRAQLVFEERALSRNDHFTRARIEVEAAERASRFADSFVDLQRERARDRFTAEVDLVRLDARCEQEERLLRADIRYIASSAARREANERLRDLRDDCREERRDLVDDIRDLRRTSRLVDFSSRGFYDGDLFGLRGYRSGFTLGLG